MKRRCKDSVFLKINLRNFKLTFRSKYRAADIEPKKIPSFQEDYLKSQKVMKKIGCIWRFQFFIKNIIFIIMEKSDDLYNGKIILVPSRGI